MYTLNYYKCISKPTVFKNISIEEWTNLIKESQYSNVIEMARNGCLDYDFAKAAIPCVTYNFNYNNYKKDDNIISSTGLLYIDIDNETFDINSLDKSKIYIYYKSFGGKGYSIIVKANGVTKDNFKSYYQSIANELNISEYIDLNAVKHSQFNVLSYDPNIFINNNSYIFQSNNEIISNIDLSNNINFTPHSIVNNKKEAYTIEGGVKSNSIRYDDTDKYVLGLKPNEYIVDFKNGFEVIKAWLPIHKIKDGYRYKFLLSYGNNLLYLNSHLKFYGLVNNLRHISVAGFENPIDEAQITKIANTLFKQRFNSYLKPIIFNKKRKIIFAKNSTLCRDEKLAICRVENAKYKTDLSKDKLYTLIEDWNYSKLGKITQAAIYKNFKISKKTVEKYWSIYKEYVNSLNEENNQIKTKRRLEIKPLEEIDGADFNNDKTNEINSTEECKIVKTQYCDVVIRDYHSALRLVEEAGATESDLLGSVQDNFDKVFSTDLKIKYRYDADSNEDYVLICVA